MIAHQCFKSVVLAQVPVELPGPAGNGRRAYWPRKVAIIGFGEPLQQVMGQFEDVVHPLQLELPNWCLGLINEPVNISVESCNANHWQSFKAWLCLDCLLRQRPKKGSGKGGYGANSGLDARVMFEAGVNM